METITENDLFYCEKENETYAHFFKGKYQVKMCGASSEDIVKVKVEIVEKIEFNDKGNDENFYYGVYDINKKEVNYIFEDLKLVKVCSFDFFRSGIENGECYFVKLSIKELNN